MKVTNGARLGTVIAAGLLLGACEAMLSDGAAGVGAGQPALQVAHPAGSGSGHGRLLPPTRVTAAGSFNGVAYIQYDGAFEGNSAHGFYPVPYRIITVADRHDDGNRIVWGEPSHSVAPTITLDYGLGRQFLFGRGFSYAVVGWNTDAGSMLDRSPGFVIWIAGEQVDDDGDGAMDEDQFDGVDNDGDGAVDEDSLTAPVLFDDDIIAHFGAALRQDAIASGMLGKVRRSYLAGASQTSPPVRPLIQNGAAEGVFAAAFPWINFDVVTGGLQSALAHGTYSGKVIVVNAEADELIHDGALLEDDGSTPND